VYAEVLDVKEAAKVFKLAKMAKTREVFTSQLVARYPSSPGTLQSLRNLHGDPEMRQEIQKAMVPRKEKTLSTEQSIGKEGLNNLQAAIKAQRAEIANRQKQLRDELKALDLMDKEFCARINQLVPQIKTVKDLSRKPLPLTYKEQAMKKYAASEQLKNTYTEVGYLSAIQAQWRQKTEADQLAAFCSFRDESAVAKVIAEARPKATPSSSKTPELVAEDVIDDDVFDV
jgi:hypothetical protein